MRRGRRQRKTPWHQCICLVLPSTPAVNVGQHQHARPREASAAKPIASHDMLVPGTVCQPRSPDLTGRDADKRVNGGGKSKGGGKVEEAAGKNEGGSDTPHDASANGDNGAGERQGKVGQGQGDGDATGGRQGEGGIRARI